MTDQEKVNRAVAVINTAIRYSMFPLGVMPESDADKLLAAEELVVRCEQAKTVADAIGKAKVKNYQAIMEILMEAGVLVGANGDGTQPFVQQPTQPAQEAQPSSPSQPASSQPQQPPASSPVVPTTSASAPAGQALTPSSASSASPSSPTSSPEQVAPVAPHPVDPDGILAEPKINEEWEAAGGGRWLVVADHGAMVDAVSRATGEQTVLLKGFLKKKKTEGFIAVEVDPEWNLPGTKGYNTLWYAHAGCARWPVPLDDVSLPAVGTIDECANCALELSVMSVEPNSYVAKPIETVDAVSSGQLTTEASVPDQPTKLHEIHLTAYPDRGVKVFEHPGCSQWETPLDGKPLLPVGVSGPCPTCGDKDVPLTVSEPNGYDPATYKPPVPQPVQPQPVQEAPPSTPQSAPSQPSPSPASSPEPSAIASPQSPSAQPVAPSAPASSSAPETPSSPSSSTERSTGAPVDNDDGDAEYRRILDQAEADFLPPGMPAPQDLESPPPAMPEDLTANPEANRELHSKFNALAARARYLAKIDERVARDCGRAVRLRLRPHMAKAKKELGASSTLTERREWAEEIGGKDVEVWLERQKRHSDRAEAYGEFFSIYSANVAVLSRDLSWAQNEERGS